MPEEHGESFSRRFEIAETEYEIRRMEVELDYHREKSRIFEEAIREKQRQLDRFEPRHRYSRLMERESNE